MTTETKVVTTLIILLFNFGLICKVATQTTSGTSDNCALPTHSYHLSNYVVPHSYNISLKMKTTGFSGQASIMIEVIRETDVISFHTKNLVIDFSKVTLAHENAFNTVILNIPVTHIYCEETQILSLLFEAHLARGDYILNIHYTGITDNSLGLVQIKSNIITSYITIFEPTGARRVFPCWDDPKFKASFKIDVTYAYGLAAFSNMPVKNRILFNDDTEIKKFMPTPLIATYLVTIGIINFDFGHANIQNRVWYGNQLIDDMEVRLQRIVTWVDRFLTQYTAGLWKNSTVHIVPFLTLPTKVVGAWQCAAFRENDIMYDTYTDFPGRLIDVWKALAHGMARQCIESLVSPAEWSDMWLSKALALYLGHYEILAQRFNMEWMTQLYVVQVLQPALHNDVTLKVPPIKHDIDHPIYSVLIYKKASAIIRMLEHIVTKQVLQQAIAEFLWKYTYSFATPDNFFDIVHKVMSEHNITGEFKYDIREIMPAWLSRRGFPTLLLIRNYSTNSITISCDDTEHSPGQQMDWLIPITITRQKYPYSQQIPMIWSNNNSRFYNNFMKDLKFDQNEWVLLNMHQVGYYRVNYDNASWLNIARYLDYNDHTKVPVLNRAQLLDDAYHFVMEDKLNMSTFVSLTKYLRKDDSFVVWHTMMNILQYMSPLFKFPESEYFKDHMLNIMNDVLEIIGYEEHSDDSSMLKAMRLLLLNWACNHGHAKCRDVAQKELIKHINKENEYPILPWWKDWTYCAGLMKQNIRMQLAMERQILRGKDPDMTKYLACFGDDQLIEAVLTRMVNRLPGVLRLEEVEELKLYKIIVKKYANKDAVLELILHGMDRLSPRYLSRMNIFLDLIMNVYSKCHLDKILESARKKWKPEEAERVVALRLKQINRLKDMFVRRFSHDIKPKEC